MHGEQRKGEGARRVQCHVAGHEEGPGVARAMTAYQQEPDCGGDGRAARTRVAA
jgi:hypothetical protein